MVTKKEILKKLEKEKEGLKEKGVKKIGLFGSYLKGKQKRGSDVDVIVKFDVPNFDRYAELLILLEKMFKRKIDLVLENQLKPELNYIKKEAEYVRL